MFTYIYYTIFTQCYDGKKNKYFIEHNIEILWYSTDTIHSFIHTSIYLYNIFIKIFIPFIPTSSMYDSYENASGAMNKGVKYYFVDTEYEKEMFVYV